MELVVEVQFLKIVIENHKQFPPRLWNPVYPAVDASDLRIVAVLHQVYPRKF